GIFSVGYVEMARRVTTAGGFYSFMSHGFGRVVGLGTAIAVAAAYMIFVPGINGVTAYFANTTISSLGGFEMDWRIYAFCFLAITFAITYFHISLVSKILGFFLIGELIILTVFSFAVLVQGGADGISLSPLNPAHLFHAHAGPAFASLGGAAAGLGFFAVGLTDLFKVLIITGSFAACLAFWNTANRYLFAMGRERILPRVLGRTRATHKSPFVATIVVALFAVMVTALFATGAAGSGF